MDSLDQALTDPHVDPNDGIFARNKTQRAVHRAPMFKKTMDLENTHLISHTHFCLFFSSF